MTDSGHPRPVRRSAIEDHHAALGARWASDRVRWPADYGDPAAERAGAANAAGLAEIGPLDKIVVRGPGARTAVDRLLPGGIDPSPEAWALADDEVLVLAAGDADPGTGDGGRLASLAATLRETGLAVTDVGSAWSALRLAGPSARELLAEVCATDLAERSVPPGGLVQAPLAGVRALLRRADGAVGPGFTILVARDEASYLWEALLELGAGHGVVPVGPAAVAAASSSPAARRPAEPRDGTVMVAE